MFSKVGREAAAQSPGEERILQKTRRENGRSNIIWMSWRQKRTTDLVQAEYAKWMGLRSCHCESVG
jgi:hypothetical protein